MEMIPDILHELVPGDLVEVWNGTVIRLRDTEGYFRQHWVVMNDVTAMMFLGSAIKDTVRNEFMVHVLTHLGPAYIETGYIKFVV